MRWVEGSSTNYLEDPAIGAILVNYHEVTDLKERETELRESERRYRELFEDSVLAIFQSSLDGKVISTNPAFARMFGYSSPEEVKSSIRNAADLFADPARRAEIVRLTTENPDLSTFENLYRRKDGSTFWGLLNIRNITDAAGRPLYFEGFIEDISERKRAEEALRESEERYRLLFEISPNSIAVYRDGRITYANLATVRLLGAKTQDDLIGKPVLDFVHPDYREIVIQRSRQQAQTGKPVSPVEEKFIRLDGTIVDVEVMAAPFPRQGTTSYLVISRDISERKQAEETLRQNEQKYRQLVEQANVGILLLDPEGRFILANSSFCRLLGCTQDEILRMTILDTYPDDLREEGRLRTERVRAGEAVYFERPLKRKDGSRILVEGSATKLENGNMQGVLIDITERKQAELALRESERRYRSLFDSSLEGIGLSQGNRIIDANKALQEILGYPELAELRAVPLLETVAPESRDYIGRRMREVNKAGVKRFVYKALRKNGEKRDLELSTDHIAIGNEVFTLSTFRDITEKKQAEEELITLADRHEALLAAIPEIIMEVDNRRIYTWANRAGIEFFGGDVLGKEAQSYFEGEQDTYKAVKPLFNGDENTVYLESWQRRKDGQKRLLGWWCRTLKNARGEVTGALSSARDITEQRQADEQIQILSRFPTENPNPVMRISPNGDLQFANKASRPFLEMWNTEVGRPVPEECRALIGDVYLTNALREIEIPCGGRTYTCTLTPIPSAGYVNVYGRDITERKQAEEALARQAEELRQRNAELARLNELTERRMQRLIAMRAIDTAITSSFKLELVLNILLGQLADLLGAHAADILVFLPDMQTYRFACGRGFRNTIPEQTFIRKAGSYANQATQERRTIKVPRLEERTDSARIYVKTAGEDFSAYLCIPLMAKGLVKGVLEIFQRAPLDLAPEEETFLEMVAGQAAIAIDNAEMFEGLQASNDELTLAYTDTLTGWARTLELRNRESSGEAQRLAETTVRLARSLGAAENELVLMYRGAILHDIGMMGVPDSILLKPGPLTEEERAVVRNHPQYAYDLLSSINYLRTAIDIPFCHHERWDGSGYPRGIKGDQIPFSARLFAVVDVWDALRSRRAFRAAWTDADARNYLRQQSGILFDPKVAQIFLEVIAGP